MKKQYFSVEYEDDAKPQKFRTCKKCGWRARKPAITVFIPSNIIPLCGNCGSDKTELIEYA